MFDKLFFEQHQRSLLRLLNAPVIGRELRSALWIAEDAPIARITPNAVHGWLGKDKYRATIYPNQQYAEALHRSFSSIWRMVHTWDMLVANKLHPALNLGFDTYSSQPDAAAGLDTYLQRSAPTTNNSAEAAVFVGTFTTGATEYRTLLKFDFSSLPPGGVPLSAILSAWLFSARDTLAHTEAIYRSKRDWVEAQATWNIWKTSNNWSTAGGFHADDSDQTAIATRSCALNEANGEQQWTDFSLTELKAMWEGTWTNNGFLIKSTNEAIWGYRGYRNSDYATAGERPKMVITYRVGGGFLVFF